MVPFEFSMRIFNLAEEGLIIGDFQSLSGHLVRVDIVDSNEFAVAELDVPPFSVLAAVLFETVLEISAKYQDGIVELHSLLQ